MGTSGPSFPPRWGCDAASPVQETCLKLKDYLDGALGHYIVNVTTSAQLCSQSLCSGHGRCVRRGDQESFLHLDPLRFAIDLSAAKPQPVVRSLAAGVDTSQLAEGFSCQCYSGWQGERCDTQRASP